MKLILCILLLLLLAQCENETVAPTALPATAEQSARSTVNPNAGVHFLLDSTGDVAIKRYGWAEYIPASYGAVLRPDDLLKVNGEADVLCADLSAAKVSGLGSAPCELSSANVISEGITGVIVRGRNPAPNDIPYILYPRRTLILSALPLLRWHDTNASKYQVTIHAGGNVVWSGVSNTSYIQYPSNGPVLKPNVSYDLQVVDMDHKKDSLSDPEIGLNFQVADDALIQKIDQASSKIQTAQGFSEVDKQFATAAFYLSVVDPIQYRELHLYGEAWKILEEVRKIQPSPAILLRLGNVLTGMGLYTEAKDAYQSTLQSARALGDLESQAEAHAQLWRLNSSRDEYNQAVQLYQKIGDLDRVEELTAEMEKNH